MAKLLITAILLVTGLSRASAADALIADAQRCSNAALNQYALSSPDPVEKVAEAAFEKCSDRWREAAEALGRELDISQDIKMARENCVKKLGSKYCPPALPSSAYYLDAARRTFVHDAAINVFDIRAKGK